MRAYLLSFLFFFLCFSRNYAVELLEFIKQEDSTVYYSNAIERPSAERDLENAYRFFLGYQERAIKAKDTLKMIYGLERLASLERNVGLYNKSEASCVEALDLIDQLKPSPYLEILSSSLHNNLGILYRIMGFNAKAKKLYQSSLELVKTPLDSMIVYLNLGNVYLDEENYSQARQYLETAKGMFNRVEDLSEKARVLTSLGIALYKDKREIGLEFMQRGLKMRKQIQDLTGLYSSYEHLASYYGDTGVLQIQKSYLDSALVVAKKLRSPAFIEDALKNLLKINVGTQAMEFVRISDSLKKANIQKESRFTLIKYDFDKLNQKVIKNELLAQKERNKSLVLGFSLIFLVFISIGFTLWLQVRNRKKRLLDVYETESRISKKIHDEVANDVYHVMAKLQQESQGNDDILDDLDTIYTKTREISKDNSVIFTKDFQTTLKDLILSFQSHQVSIVIKGLSNIKWENLKGIEKITIYKVLQELMVNMRKHSRANLVGLTFEQNGAKLLIGYSDNGIGSHLKKQLGLQNMENRMRSIGGSITFDTEPNKGFKSKIIL